MISDDIIVVGSCMIDFVSYAPRLPKPGETIHGSKFVTNFGGKGANQCVAAANLVVGDDVWGRKYIDNLKTENWHSPNKCVRLGENQIVIVAGANKALNVQDVENAQNVISGAAVVVLQLETSVDVAIRAIQLCKGVC
ncbi:hypothetical protein NQ314_001013 [Rhamnusium bicolor]|uniref:Carbohydrate kinase PfkB domain-containing protein n=1 Tax=Rhamnusium bicolor TaxID=1586634 RepID=A0AAV8ZTE4_9CUCU|nr:hypothetical protein NQ314_001013 [Rhamnusium bicolor]